MKKIKTSSLIIDPKLKYACQTQMKGFFSSINLPLTSSSNLSLVDEIFIPETEMPSQHLFGFIDWKTALLYELLSRVDGYSTSKIVAIIKTIKRSDYINNFADVSLVDAGFKKPDIDKFKNLFNNKSWGEYKKEHLDRLREKLKKGMIRSISKKTKKYKTKELFLMDLQDLKKIKEEIK